MMQYKYTPPSLEEIRETRPSVKHPHKEARISFSKLERLAVKVTHGVGSVGFFLILAMWTIGWLVWNVWAPVHLRFDPAPAFVVWLIASNIIQLVLLPLIMVGQNLEGKFAEHRAEEDYRINKKAEKEIEIVVAHLENQNEMLLELMRKFERR